MLDDIDFDIFINFWIKDIPYIWIKGDNIKECKRLYLISSYTISIFTEENNITNRNNLLILSNLKNNDILTLKIPLFYMLPFMGEECEKYIKNYFMVETLLFYREHSIINDSTIINKKDIYKIYPKSEIRLEGNIFLGDDIPIIYPLSFDNHIKIINPKSDVENYINYVVVPWQYKATQHNPPYNIGVPIIFAKKKYASLYEVIVTNTISDTTIIMNIHISALVNLYVNITENPIIAFQTSFFIKNTVLQMITNIVGTFSKTTVCALKEWVKTQKLNWKYENMLNISDAQLLYEILIKKRHNYEVFVSKMEKDTNEKFTPVIPKKVTYNKDSLKIAKKVTKNYNNKSTNIDVILREFYQKFKTQVKWTTNKESSIKQYEKFLEFVPIQNPVYVDIGCSDGEVLALLSKEMRANKAICCDIKDTRNDKESDFILITPNVVMSLENNSVDIISIFHTLHHMEDAKFRLEDIVRILKVGGVLFVKDHDVVSYTDVQNVTFEHFVYSIGEGSAKLSDKDRYNEIESMYYYSEEQLTSYLKLLGIHQVYVDKYNNLTKTYISIYKKM